MSWAEIKYAINRSLGTDKFRPLDVLQLERTLVDRYSKESLIWALTQFGIGTALNQMYQLKCDALNSCNTIDEIYDTKDALRACLNRGEIVELLYLYPYLDFKKKIRSTYTLSNCIPENLVNNIYFIGDVVKINLVNYGDVDFVMIDKNYDDEGTSCWMTVDTLFTKNISLSSWHSWTGEVKTSIMEVSNQFTDKNILNSLQTVTRKYASLDEDDSSLNNSIKLESKTWVPSANQMKINDGASNLEDPVLEYYNGHSQVRSNAYTCLRTMRRKINSYDSIITIRYITNEGTLGSYYGNTGNATSTAKYSLGVPIAITIKG